MKPVLRYTIPNSFTAASLLLGLASIVTSQLGDLELAGWMIVWCGLLDVLDGLDRLRALEDERHWDDIEAALGAISDKGHEWDTDPAEWVRRQRGGDSRRTG